MMLFFVVAVLVAFYAGNRSNFCLFVDVAVTVAVVVVVDAALFCSIQWLWFCVSAADIIYDPGKDNEKGGKSRKGSGPGFLVFPDSKRKSHHEMNSIYLFFWFELTANYY